MLGKVTNNINISYPYLETWGKWYITITYGLVFLVLGVCTPFTNWFMLPLAYKYKNKEIFKI